MPPIFESHKSSQQLLRLKSIKSSIIATIISSYSTLGFATECTTQTETSIINIPNITIPRDTPIGAEIGTSVITPPIDAFSCTKGFSYQEFGFKGYGTPAQKINGLNIYKLGSNTSGIGYSVHASILSACSDYFYSLDNSNHKIFCSVNGTFAAQPMQGSIKLVFYKIGDITPRAIPEQTVASLILRNNQKDWQRPESYLKTAPFTVSTHGCSLNTANIKVPLGMVEMKELSSSGITAAEKIFSIPLSCDTGTKVKLTLDAGPAGVYDNTNGLLNLTNPASANTAQGVKIQILSNNVPVIFGKPLEVRTQTNEGAFDIPLQARYYRSVETLKAGVADATTTYIITYE